MVVHCERTADGPVVSEIVCVEDQAAGPDATAFTVTNVFGRSGQNSSLAWSGSLPMRVGAALESSGTSLRELLGVDSVGVDSVGGDSVSRS